MATSATATLAEGPVYLEQTPPAGSAPVQLERTIYLAAGTYDWLAFVAPTNGAQGPGVEKSIYLDAGTYTWTYDLYPNDPSSGYYEMQSSLALTGHATATLASGSFVISTGDYDVGSTLTPA